MALPNEDLPPLFTKGGEDCNQFKARESMAFHRKAAGIPGSPYPNGKLLDTDDFISHLMDGGTVVTHKGREYKIPIGCHPEMWIQELEGNQPLNGYEVSQHLKYMMAGRSHGKSFHRVSSQFPFIEPKPADPEVKTWLDECSDKIMEATGIPNKLLIKGAEECGEVWLVKLAGDLGGIKVNPDTYQIEFHGDLDAAAKEFAKFVNAHLQSLKDGDRDQLGWEINPNVAVDPAKGDDSTYTWPSTALLPGDE